VHIAVEQSGALGKDELPDMDAWRLLPHVSNENCPETSASARDASREIHEAASAQSKMKPCKQCKQLYLPIPCRKNTAVDTLFCQVCKPFPNCLNDPPMTSSDVPTVICDDATSSSDSYRPWRDSDLSDSDFTDSGSDDLEAAVQKDTTSGLVNHSVIIVKSAPNPMPKGTKV
jgi:hypothetical protein